MGKSEALFKFTGMLVGDAVVAEGKAVGLGKAYGRKATDLCKSGLTTVGGASSLLLGKRGRMGRSKVLFRFAGACAGNTVAAERKVRDWGAAAGRKTFGLYRAGFSSVASVPGALFRKPRNAAAPAAPPLETEPIARPSVERAPTRPEVPRPATKISPPRVDEAPRVPAPPPSPVPPVPPAKKKAVVKPAPARVRPVPEKAAFTMPAPAEVDSAEFSGVAQKVVFRRALSDLSHRDSTMRARAADAMGNIRNELSMRALAAHFFIESSSRVRKECINALGTLDLKDGLAVVEKASQDPESSVRLAAVMAAYRLAGAESSSMLLHMLQDEDPEVRRRAASCVGWLGQAKLAVQLLPLLSDDALRVRAAAVEAMGALRNRQTVSPLLEFFNGADELLQKKILEAIERITGKTMNAASPQNDEERERLVARWRHWWAEQASH